MNNNNIELLTIENKMEQTESNKRAMKEIKSSINRHKQMLAQIIRNQEAFEEQLSLIQQVMRDGGLVMDGEILADLVSSSNIDVEANLDKIKHFSERAAGVILLGQQEEQAVVGEICSHEERVDSKIDGKRSNCYSRIEITVGDHQTKENKHLTQGVVKSNASKQAGTDKKYILINV